jgi:membrane fusion protein (multidrug efflux system)
MGKWLVFIAGCCGLVAAGFLLSQPEEESASRQGPRDKLVEVKPAQSATVQDAIEALGTLRANEEVTIVAEAQGVIKQINFEEGALVRAGSTLIVLDDEEEKALLDSAKAIAAEAERQYDRLADLAKRNTVSQSRVDEQRAAVSTAQANARVAQVRLNQRIITAPFTGRIGLREVSPGDLLQVGSAVTTLDDVTVLKILFDVPEKYLSSLRPGIEIAGRSAAYPGQIFTGIIDRVDTRVDPLTRTIDVQAVIPNDANLLKPGLSMTVELLGKPRMALTVDESAIIAIEDRQYAFVAKDGIAERRQVDIGLRKNGQVEIKSGISPGDVVVVKGLQGLNDGATIKIKGAAQSHKVRTPDEQKRAAEIAS